QEDLFPQQSVKNHQQRSIERFELVVPKDVKQLGLREEGITNQLGVIRQDPRSLPGETCAGILFTTQIQEIRLRVVTQFGELQIIASDDVQTDSLRKKLGRQAIGVRSV